MRIGPHRRTHMRLRPIVRLHPIDIRALSPRPVNSRETSPHRRTRLCPINARKTWSHRHTACDWGWLCPGHHWLEAPTHRVYNCPSTASQSLRLSHTARRPAGMDPRTPPRCPGCSQMMLIAVVLQCVIVTASSSATNHSDTSLHVIVKWVYFVW